jgi:osmotically-inducible protein OsmY
MRVIFSVLLLALLVWIGSAYAQKAPPTDDWIYDQVRLRLASNPDVKGAAIDVTVKEGVVTLRGKVRTGKAHSKAQSLTSKVKGVKQVINELKVDPT